MVKAPLFIQPKLRRALLVFAFVSGTHEQYALLCFNTFRAILSVFVRACGLDCSQNATSATETSV